jgi:hypothetical protein
MKKKILIFALVTGIVTNGIAQQNVGTNLTNSLPATTPANISQLETRVRLITQNFYNSPTSVQTTGNFGNTARWNSMGSLNAGTQILNGFRSQTDGRGLTMGYTVTGTTLSNPTIQWIGNVTSASVTSGDLEFRVADNPGGSGSPASDRLVLKLRSDNRVIIGQQEISGSNFLTDVNVNSSLAVEGGIFVDVTGLETASPIGLRTSVVGGSTATGVEASATSNLGGTGSITRGIRGTGRGNAALITVGVSGTAVGTAATRYGVFGEVSGTGTSVWAGYFAGNVFATGTYTSSDEKLKTKIQDEKALQQILQLHPVNYFYNEAAVKDLNMPAIFQHGFIAQEMEKVFPEMVTTVTAPVFSRDEKSNKEELIRTETFKGINYTSLIPLLTKAIQEQQQMIEEQNKKIAALEAAAKTSTANAKGYTLSQNIPNPFSAATTIRYSLPDNTGSALLAVFDLTGKMLLQYNLAKAGNQITINGNTLVPGIYIYSLIVNGTEMLSKKMLLTK